MVSYRKLSRRFFWLPVCLALSPAMQAEDVLQGVDIMSPELLQQANGRQGIPFQWQVNDTEQNGVVSDNVLQGHVMTGNNSISDNAFQNMNGVATVIQNTGNQVVIQDSTQINVLINR